jgi:hypothetical protein
MVRPKPKDITKLSRAAKQDVSWAGALKALFGPLQEGAEAELEETESGRKLLEETRAFGEELGKLYESIDSKKPLIKRSRSSRDNVRTNSASGTMTSSLRHTLSTPTYSRRSRRLPGSSAQRWP